MTWWEGEVTQQVCTPRTIVRRQRPGYKSRKDEWTNLVLGYFVDVLAMREVLMWGLVVIIVLFVSRDLFVSGWVHIKVSWIMKCTPPKLA